MLRYSSFGLWSGVGLGLGGGEGAVSSPFHISVTRNAPTVAYPHRRQRSAHTSTQTSVTTGTHFAIVGQTPGVFARRKAERKYVQVCLSGRLSYT